MRCRFLLGLLLSTPGAAKNKALKHQFHLGGSRGLHAQCQGAREKPFFQGHHTERAVPGRSSLGVRMTQHQLRSALAACQVRNLCSAAGWPTASGQQLGPISLRQGVNERLCEGKSKEPAPGSLALENPGLAGGGQVFLPGQQLGDGGRGQCGRAEPGQVGCCLLLWGHTPSLTPTCQPYPLLCS